jgi:hypothetical protein
MHMERLMKNNLDHSGIDFTGRSSYRASNFTSNVVYREGEPDDRS